MKKTKIILIITFLLLCIGALTWKIHYENFVALRKEIQFASTLQGYMDSYFGNAEKIKALTESINQQGFSTCISPEELQAQLPLLGDLQNASLCTLQYNFTTQEFDIVTALHIDDLHKVGEYMKSFKICLVKAVYNCEDPFEFAESLLTGSNGVYAVSANRIEKSVSAIFWCVGGDLIE